MNGFETTQREQGPSRSERRPRKLDILAVAEESLWSGTLCVDHPDFAGREMPEDRTCKNCWRLLMGFPTRMYTDRFSLPPAQQAA